MTRNVQRIISLFIACMSAIMSAVPVYAEEPQDFDQTERPVMENTTDASRLPGYNAELSDVYGQVDTTDADVIDSMISDDAKDAFARRIDQALDFEPAAMDEVSTLLTKKKEFIESGGIEAYLEDHDLQGGSEIGLADNREDLITVLGTDTNASSWIYVVDKDSMYFVVQDEQEKGIAKALVTLSWIADDGSRVSKSTVATDGNTPGIAVFANLPESFHGIVDIQAEGYRASTVLDMNLGSGKHFTHVLKTAEENDLYIRGADLSGKDLINEETEVTLVNGETEDLTLSVLVTKTGSEQFPSSVDLYSENRDHTILTLTESSEYDISDDTRIYSAVRRYAEQGADLFKEDDRVSVKVSDRTYALTHMSFVNAVVTPRLEAATMPMRSKPMPGDVTDRLGGSGVLNVTGEILHVPVQIGVFPNGDAIIMASYDITNLDPNTQYKYSSLFQKSWNPKTLDNVENCLEIFEKSFWENAEKIKGGKEKLESADKVACLTNKNYNVSMSFGLFLRSNCNRETKDCYGTGGILFSAGVTGGITEYFLFIAGPVVIPAYIGFEAGFMINTSLNLAFGINQPPVSEAQDVKWAYAAGGEEELTSRIEVLVSFAVFGGIGVKGVLGASATGYVNLDIATVLGKGEGNIFTAREHSFIDLLFGLKFHYYLLFFTGEIRLECLNGGYRIYDNNGEHDLVSEEDREVTFTPLSLSDCADQLVPVLGEEEEGITDMAYTFADDPQVSAGSDIINVDSLTYPDSQIQFAAAKNCTALFRIVSDGTKTKLVYQMLDRDTGDLEPVVYEVAMPDERSVTEFVVAANKTDADQEAYCDNVYIGAILADNSLEEMVERAGSTDVAAVVVNLAERKTLSSDIVSDQSDVYKKNYYYSAPLPAGAEDYCAVAYCASHISELETQAEFLEALGKNTENYMAAYSKDYPGVHTTVGLGYGKVYSTGVIAPNEPSYWLVDQIHSTDKTLALEGIGSNGYYSETDPRCNIRVDISDRPASDFDYSNIISNWQFMNGRNYFFVYDSVWWTDKVFADDDDHTQYSWSTQKVKGSEKLSDADYRYAMITDNNQAAVYIVGVVGDYEINMEKGTAKKTANRVQIYPLITETTYYDGKKTTCTVHGPLTIGFAYGDPVVSFAAVYNPESSASKGVSIVYSTPAETPSANMKKAGSRIHAKDTLQEEEQSADAAALRMWKQNADRGMRVTEVSIPEYIITNDQKFINVYVKVRNYGYAIERDVMYHAYDEEGHQLALSNGKKDLDDDDIYSIGYLYTGDTATDYLMVRPYPGWNVNEEHEIRIEVIDRYYYPGNLDDVVNTAKLQADNTSLHAENTLNGDKHYVSVSIQNNSLIAEKTPVIQAVLDYEDPEKEKTLLFELPVKEMVRRFKEDGNGTDETIWHYEIDMDQIWKDGLKEGLRGAVFSLVDEEGIQQSNETIWLSNPAEEISDRAEGMKTDEDGNPLPGAVFSLYNDANEEVMTAVSAEDGTFRFADLEAGSYIIKETEAPEGYVKDDTEHAFEASGNGETFSFTAVNRRIQGSVKVILKDDKGSPVSGAKFAVYSGDQLIGYLKDEGKGVYTLDNLVYGEYTVKCEKMPDGYESVEPLPFSIKEDGKTVEVQAKAVQKTPAKPTSADTRDSNRIPLYLGILGISLLIFLGVLIQRRRLQK